MGHLNIVVDNGGPWSQMAEILWPRLDVRDMYHVLPVTYNDLTSWKKWKLVFFG